MKTKQNYWYRITEAFFYFAMADNRINEKELTKVLKMTEKEEKELHIEKSGGLWFRFGDSPSIYTIRDIENDLSGPKNNRDFLIEQMEEAVSNDPDYLQINFS